MDFLLEILQLNIETNIMFSLFVCIPELVDYIGCVFRVRQGYRYGGVGVVM